jgi:uncharacterized protein
MRCSCSLAILFAVALPALAAEPDPSPRQRELIDRLLAVSNASRNLSAEMDALLAQIENEMVRSSGADRAAEERERYDAFRERARNVDYAAPMHEAWVRTYAKYFTESELADLVAFAETPTGRKSIQVTPQLLSEALDSGMESLTPKMRAIMDAVKEEQEKKRPWRRTKADITDLGTAIEAYSSDQKDGTYPAGDFAALKTALRDGPVQYLSDVPEKDMWGNPYVYVVSEDRHHYRIVSSGADSKFEPNSLRVVQDSPSYELRYSDRPEDDLIYCDGVWIQLPAQAEVKPKVFTTPATDPKPR